MRECVYEHTLYNTTLYTLAYCREISQRSEQSLFHPALPIEEKSGGHCSVSVSSVMHGSFPYSEDAGNISNYGRKTSVRYTTMQTALAPKTALQNATGWNC